MTHVFVAPHPDDAALSCGGLIASLRELGQSVTILTVFSGNGAAAGLTQYQREALGFGNKAVWPTTEAFNRENVLADQPLDPAADAPYAADPARLDATQADADASAKRFWQRASWYRRAEIHNRPLHGQPLMDDLPQQGAVLTAELVEAKMAGDLTAARRLEDERYAYFAEASIVFLDLPDAVFRGYEGDDQLLAAPRADDTAPVDLLVQEIARLEPQKVYLPLGIGDHVDHQLVREVGVHLLQLGRRWVMPGPEYAGIVTYYEDFPYAWWNGFSGLRDLDGQGIAVPRGLTLEARYADISDQLERKGAGLQMYASVITQLFESEQGMLDAVAGYAARVAQAGGVGTGAAERYWGVAGA
jgi:LmbE family N-acetylglucosaminyl deacetylase